jgi:hypothetical protein
MHSSFFFIFDHPSVGLIVVACGDVSLQRIVLKLCWAGPSPKALKERLFQKLDTTTTKYMTLRDIVVAYAMQH